MNEVGASTPLPPLLDPIFFGAITPQKPTIPSFMKKSKKQFIHVMSIPLPPSGLSSSKNNESISVNDVYLDVEERYEIHNVKVNERPHLIHYSLKKAQSPSSTTNIDVDTKETKYDEEAEEDDEDLLPLIDGCDIPGWRKEEFIPVSSTELQSRLNIGTSYYLLHFMSF